MGIQQIGGGLSLVLDLMEDLLASQTQKTPLVLVQTENPLKTVTHLGQDLAEILMGGKDHMIQQE